jgi:L-gulonolactone oxidase
LAASPFVERDDIRSFGRVTQQPQFVARPRFRDELPRLLESNERESRLAVGLRRSYGDSCLDSAGALIETRGLDRFLSFDAASGVLRAEAGVSLSEILALVVPRGWFLPTTPGTRFVTLGGALANDVHGKNHHRAGAFGRHIRAFSLLRSDRGPTEVTLQSDPQLFCSTIGGLGLTGVIEWVELQLVRIGSAFLDVETIPFDRLDAFWPLAEESAQRFEHTVAWIDCTTRGPSCGRGVFTGANWRADGVLDIHDDKLERRMPIDAPGFALNRLSVGAFNELYFRRGRAAAGASRQHYSQYFYPLDALLDWNRLYGKRGMMQYQCVVPRANAQEATRALLDVITASEQASFLAVLKTFGDLRSPGLLSFPRAGATLALDFPFRGERTLRLMARLDDIVREAQGALYPAKDGRMTSDMFRRSFPRWAELARDPAMNSDFWRRVTR